MTIKILIADDEPSICEVVELYLSQAGFQVLVAMDGDKALDLEAEHRPDLLILDIMLPKMDGWTICQSVKRRVPIIFLTAKNAEADKITGFSLGADDYITKPFSPRELVARVKAVLRRSGLLSETDNSLIFDGLTVEPTTLSVTSHEKSINLSPKEFELLVFLARRPRVAFSREQLVLNIWGYDFVGDDRTVDATIKRLRQKINNDKFSYIHTIWGVGYKFEVVAK